VIPRGPHHPRPCRRLGRLLDDQPGIVKKHAAYRAAIDASTDAAMSKLFARVAGSRELVAKAQGTLVFPNVVTARLVVGSSYGKGELLVHAAATVITGRQ
jgi:lipid-binding SYLF domain-containing protein